MTIPDTQPPAPRALDGSSLAALLAAGIGASALGLIVLLDAAGGISVPTLYGPAGGVSGRTTFAVIAWLGSWAVLHHRWKRAAPARSAARRIFWGTAVLIVFGLLATFPPVWEVF